MKFKNPFCNLLTQILPLFLTLIFVKETHAQNIITGIITAHKQPLYNASVALLAAKDSQLVKGVFSQQNGIYKFENVTPGNYLVQASFSGFADVFSQSIIVSAGSGILHEDLALATKENALEEVVVMAKKPLFEQKIDRMVINVASSITNAGNTALEVLMRSPGIMVDRQNSSLSMNGKSGVVVMINGKISRMPIAAVVQMLSGMNASNIERIELITTPPANFDAEGNAGYINIVLKQNTQFGTNGSYTVTGNYGKLPFGSTSVYLNHRKGKINLFGDFAYSLNRSITNISIDRTVQQNINTLQYTSNMDNQPLNQNSNGRLGLDIELNKKTTIGFMGTYSWNRLSQDANTIGSVIVNNVLDTIIAISNSELHPMKNYTANLNLTHQFSENHKLVFNADYVYYHDQDNTDYNNKYKTANGTLIREEPVKSGKTTPIQFWVSSLDESWKIGKKIKMEAGIKGTLSKFNNNVTVQRSEQNLWKIDTALTVGSHLTESIVAAYTSFDLQLSENTAVKAGLRYEYTNSNLGTLQRENVIDKHYGRFFPSIFLSQKLTEKQSVNVSYTRRINRPTFNDMAPFVYFVDPNTFFSGNPALQPSISDAVKLDYLFHQFILSVSYSYEQNTITNYSPRVNPVTNKLTLFAENQPFNKALSINVSVPWKVNKWWNMQNNISLSESILKAIYNDAPFITKRISFSPSSTQTFSFSKGLSLELNGYYVSGGMFSVYKLKGFANFSFGLQKKFEKQRSNLRINVYDLPRAPHYKLSIDQPEKNLVTTSSWQFSNTSIGLTYTKNFGNDKIKARRDRGTASDAERQRVSN